jgi:hypothetical protein
MRLIKQFNLLNKHINQVKIDRESLDGNRTYTITNIHHLLTALIALIDVPVIADDVTILLRQIGRVQPGEKYTISASFLSDLSHSIQTIKNKGNILRQALSTVIEPENENVVYIELGSERPLEDVVDFIGKFPKYLNRILGPKFHQKISLTFEGVEKGSDWIMLQVNFSTDTASTTVLALGAAVAFLEITNQCIELWKNVRIEKDRIENSTRSLKTEYHEPATIYANAMIESHKENAIQSLMRKFPLSQDQELTECEKNDIANTMLQLGKTVVEETTIEVSGLLEESCDQETKLLIESLKINTKRSTEYLPKKESES